MSSSDQQLGKYRVGNEIGRGGFATVFRAVDTRLNREVALKILHPQLLTERSFVESFYQEASTIARLEHPHIVPIHEADEVGGRLFIAMKYVRGRSLAATIGERGRLPWRETLALLKPIAAALNYAHSCGVVHRDLKPSNILLDERGTPYLSDFGFARAIAENSVTMSSGRIVGTPGYIAPEVWDMNASTPAVDIYALGCVVYEMLTGVALFTGKTPLQAVRAHERGPQFPASWPDDLPAGVEPVLAKALAKDPTQRHGSAGELVKELLALDPEVTLPGGKAPARSAIVVVPPPPEQPPDDTDHTPPGDTTTTGTSKPPGRTGCSIQTSIAVSLAVAALALFGGLAALTAVRSGYGAASATIPAAGNTTTVVRETVVVGAPVTETPTNDLDAQATSAALNAQATEVAASRATNDALVAQATSGALAQATAQAIFAQATALAEQATALVVQAEQATAGAAQTAQSEQTAAVAAQAEQATATAIALASAQAEQAAATAAARQTAEARPNAPRPTGPPPTARPTARPTAPPASGGDTRTSSRGGLFEGGASKGTGARNQGCIVGRVTDVNGNNFTSFYVQVDNRGRTIAASHDYLAGEYSACGLSPGVWGVAVYAVNDVPTGGEAAAHQIRVQLSGEAGEIWYVNFKAIRAFP